MSLGNFSFAKIKLEKQEQGVYLVMKGEITNYGGKSYQAVSFRAIVFVKTIAVGNVIFVLNGFNSGQTREFEVQIADLKYDKVARDISRYELFVESGY